MIYLITATDQQGTFRQFTCQLPQIQTWFVFIHDLVAEGNTLLSAEIREDHQVTSLPIDLFKHASVMADMEQLDNEWTMLDIARSSPGLSPNPGHLLWCQQQLVKYEQMVVRIELMMTSVSQSLSALSAEYSLPTDTLTRHYENTLRSYERQADRANSLRSQFLKYLNDKDGR